MVQAAIYCRISHDRLGDGLGVARQEQDCRALCERQGWQVAEVYVDNDVSAYKGRVRPGYAAMMGRLKEGGLDVVVAWHPDRLHRAPRELEDFIDALDAAGASVATVTAGEYDLSTPEGKLVARIVGAVARQESEHKSRRAQRKALELAERGEVSGGGDRPFGFEPDRRTIRETEAALIREAADRLLNGGSLRGVAKDWERRGIKAVRGGAWSMHTLRRVLVSPRVAGKRAHRGEVVAEAAWPAILDEFTWTRLRVLLLDPARRQGTPRRYLLTGIAVCGLCGAKLVARPNQRKKRCYVCASGPGFKGCGRIRVLAEPLEAWVGQEVCNLAELATIVDTPEPIEPALAELHRVEAELAALAVDHYEAKVIGRTEFLAAADALRKRQEALQATVRLLTIESAARRLMAVPRGLRDRWPKLGMDQQRSVIVGAVSSVTVGSAVKGRTTFDRLRVSIDWRT